MYVLLDTCNTTSYYSSIFYIITYIYSLLVMYLYLYIHTTCSSNSNRTCVHDTLVVYLNPCWNVFFKFLSLSFICYHYHYSSVIQSLFFSYDHYHFHYYHGIIITIKNHLQNCTVHHRY